MLPRIVYQMTVHGALLVGSYARKLADPAWDYEPGDIDLLVPFQHWSKIAMLIPETAKPNKFGGWRFLVNKPYGTGEVVEYDLDTIVLPAVRVLEIDVWPGDLHEYLTNCKSKHGDHIYVVDFIHNRVYSARTQAI